MINLLKGLYRHTHSVINHKKHTQAEGSEGDIHPLLIENFVTSAWRWAPRGHICVCHHANTQCHFKVKNRELFYHQDFNTTFAFSSCLLFNASIKTSYIHSTRIAWPCGKKHLLIAYRWPGSQIEFQHGMSYVSNVGTVSIRREILVRNIVAIWLDIKPW